MWRCTNCRAINTSDVCTLCGLKRGETVIQAEAEQSMVAPSEPTPVEYTPETVAVSEPAPVVFTPEPVVVSEPTPVEYTPEPVAVSEPAPAEYTPETVAVSEPAPVEYTPEPVAVSEPTSAVFTPEPVAVSEPTSAEYTPETVAVSEPTSAAFTPEPVAVSEPISAEYTPETVAVNEPAFDADKEKTVIPPIGNVNGTSLFGENAQFVPKAKSEKKGSKKWWIASLIFLIITGAITAVLFVCGKAELGKIKEIFNNDYGKNVALTVGMGVLAVEAFAATVVSVIGALFKRKK